MAEPARKLDYPTAAHKIADGYLEDIAATTLALKKMEVEWKAELDQLATRWKAKMAPQKALLGELEVQIEKHMKVNRNQLFDGTDRVDLANGALIFAVIKRVKRARNLLERLEKINADDAIAITKSVDWEKLETWTDERLLEIGTERVKEDKFSWELREDKNGPAKN